MKRTALAAFVAAMGVMAVAEARAQDDAGQVDTAAAPAEQPAAPLWLMSCSNQLTPDELMCEISQTIVLSNGNQRLATVSLTRAAGKSETNAVFLLPVGISIPEGVSISVDETEIAQLNYQSCDVQGCFATSAVDDTWLGAMRAGQQMFIGLKSRDGQDIRLAIQLDGFTKAEAMFP